MSKNTTNPTIVLAENEESTVVDIPVEKQSFIKKTGSFISKHKKPLIAAGLLSGLVGGAALLGRKTAPSNEEPTPDDSIEIVEFDGGFAVLDTNA